MNGMAESGTLQTDTKAVEPEWPEGATYHINSILVQLK